MKEYSNWVFCDAATNQIRISKSRKKKFTSYTQLKKYQKRLKLDGIMFLLVVVSLFVGLFLGPNIFPKKIQSELYIPNGRGDILLANISKNQVTVVFKTLDSADNNKPLATKAFVEFFSDENYSNMVRRSVVDDYAVTHIIPVDSLQENKAYYIRLTAQDSSEPMHISKVTSWGDGNDPIKVYTSGEIIPICENSIENIQKKDFKEIETGDTGIISAPFAESSNDFVGEKFSDKTFGIFDVMNENHLQPKNKVQTIISWNTNKPSTTVLIYGEKKSNDKKEIVISDEMRMRHAAVLTSLKAGTTYYFSVKSISDDGVAVVSEEYSLRTPNPQSTVLDKIAESFKSLFK